MTTNVQHVHLARAEMLRVASRHPAARPDRSACAVLCPCRWCLRADGPCATSSSYQPDLPGAANISVRLTFTSSASLGRICLSACATLAVVCACVPRGIMGMVGYGSPSCMDCPHVKVARLELWAGVSSALGSRTSGCARLLAFLSIAYSPPRAHSRTPTTGKLDSTPMRAAPPPPPRPSGDLLPGAEVVQAEAGK